MLPVSSSGHLALVPRLAGWPYASLPGDVRKSFEVALHAGSAPALAWVAGARMHGLTPLLLTVGPPAVAGLAGERFIEERLGGPRAVAVAQIVAGAAMLLADLRPESRRQPDALDHLAVGLGQAAALVPGVSRAGGAITAARLRGLDRRASVELSWRAALPVTLAAGALKAFRNRRTPVDPAFAAGALAAGLASAASVPLARRLAESRSLAPIAAYRMIFGGIALASGRC